MILARGCETAAECRRVAEQMPHGAWVWAPVGVFALSVAVVFVWAVWWRV